MSGSPVGRNWRLYLSGVFMLLVALTVLDYVVGVHSDAMAFAVPRIIASPSIRREVGEPIRVSLRKFWGYSHRSGYGNSSARLSLVVRGSRREVGLTIHLRQVNSQWEVFNSTMPL
jgi:hypothetical protein